MYSMMNSAVGLRTMAGNVAGFSQVMARGAGIGGIGGIGGIDSEAIAEVVQEAKPARESAVVQVDRKELLERLKVAGKGDGAILSINGRVDISAMFGRAQAKRTSTDVKGVVTVHGRSFNREYELQTRDDWNREGEQLAEIDAQKLAKILGKVKSDSVNLELWRETGADGETQSGLLVKTDRAEFQLETFDAEDWENRPTLETQSLALVDSQELSRGILAVVNYCDTDSTRYALGGVNVELSADGITLAATDSRRLGVITIPCEFADGFQDDCVTIPKNALLLIADQLKRESGQVAIAIQSSEEINIETGEKFAPGFQVESETWTVSGKVVDGRFPNWRMVIPANFAEYLQIDRSELVECLETAGLCCNSENRGCEFTLTENGLQLETSGDGKCRVVCAGVDRAYGGVDFKATLDVRFLLEYLKTTGETSVVLAFNDGESAVVLEAEGAARYVVMPLSKDR